MFEKISIKKGEILKNKVLKLQVLKVKLIINYQLFKTLFKGFYLSLVSKE